MILAVMRATVKTNSQTQCTSCDNVLYKPDNPILLKILIESKLNWFEFIDRLEESDTSITPGIADEFFVMLPSLGLTQQELELVVQSHRAFAAASDASYEQEHLARCINGK